MNQNLGIRIKNGNIYAHEVFPCFFFLLVKVVFPKNVRVDKKRILLTFLRAHTMESDHRRNNKSAERAKSV